jgi:hypothetical protein
MRQLLKLHPDTRSFAVAQIEVDVARPSADSLALSYTVSGTMGDVRMPPIAAATRSDDLWRHTCFEVFIRSTSSAQYYELNFAPSTQWAAYRFNGYRTEMCAASEISALPIDAQGEPGCYILRTLLALNQLSALSRNAMWQLGLSALIEETSGHKSYWALSHPPGKPDFHHADCFAHEFSPGFRS